MAWVTAITAVVGAAVGIGTAVKGSQDAKKAEQAQQRAKADLRNMKEQNAFADLTAPDISTLAFEQQALQEQQEIQALQESGAEAVLGGIGKVSEASRNAGIQTARDQAVLESQVDIQKAVGEQEINKRKFENEQAIAEAELIGAQQAEADGEAAMWGGITRAIGSAGQLAGEIGAGTSLESQAQRAAKKGTTNNTAPQSKLGTGSTDLSLPYTQGKLTSEGFSGTSAYENPLKQNNGLYEGLTPEELDVFGGVTNTYSPYLDSLNRKYSK